MDFEKFAILKGRLEAYADINAYDLGALKANLDDPANARFRDIFARELQEAIADDVFTPASYEALTGESFDDDDALRQGLRAMQAFLLEGGPHP